MVPAVNGGAFTHKNYQGEDIMQEIKKNLKDIFEKITTEKSFCKIIIFLMLALPISELFDERHFQDFNSQPTLVEMVGIALFACLAVHFLIHKNIKYYPSDLLFLLLFVFAALSATFTLDREATFLGFYYDEWITNFICYFSLMAAAATITDTKLKKEIIRAFILVILIQNTVAVFQSFGCYLEPPRYDAEELMGKNMCYGLIEHSNWYGGLSVLMFACSSGIFLFAEKTIVRNASFVLSLVCFYTLFCTEARLALVGVFSYIFFMLVSMLIMKKKDYKKEKLRSIFIRFGILMAGIIAISAIAILVFGRLKWKIERTSDELIGLKEGNTESIGTRRGYIWKKGLATVPDHWLFGIGLDNYRYAFKLDPEYKSGMFTQGKGHNEYIHYLVTQGALQLLTYLTLLVTAVVTAVRAVIHSDDDEERFLNWTLLGMFFGYAAQACFNSSVVNVVPYFWITIGLCLSKKNQRYFGYRKEHGKSAKK